MGRTSNLLSKLFGKCLLFLCLSGSICLGLSLSFNLFVLLRIGVWFKLQRFQSQWNPDSASLSHIRVMEVLRSRPFTFLWACARIKKAEKEVWSSWAYMMCSLATVPFPWIHEVRCFSALIPASKKIQFSTSLELQPCGLLQGQSAQTPFNLLDFHLLNFLIHPWIYVWSCA